MPPIEVVPLGVGTYVIADGVHRFHALRSLNRTEVEVVVVTPARGSPGGLCISPSPGNGHPVGLASHQRRAQIRGDAAPAGDVTT